MIHQATFWRGRVSRLATPLLLACLAACRPDVEGEVPCTSTASCPTGYACAADSTCSLEAEIFCNVPCGAGFECRFQTDGTDSCVLEEGRTVTVTTDPMERVQNTLSVFMTCRTNAPQLRTVTLAAEGTHGLTEFSIGAEAGIANGNLNLFDDTYEVRCVIEYGPKLQPIVLQSAPVTISLDRTRPVIELELPTWICTSLDKLYARIRDEGFGALGIKEARLETPAGSVPMWSVVGDMFGFEVDCSLLGTPGQLTDVTYTVTALDHAGNAASASGTVKVDRR